MNPVDTTRRWVAVLALGAMLVGAPVSAATPVSVGDSWVVTDGHQDAARVTLLEVRVTRSIGLRRAPPGKRFYLLHLRYRWVKGQPYVGWFDWLAERRNGRNLRRVRVPHRLPTTILYRDARPGRNGWLAWVGPAYGVRATMLRDGRRWVVTL